MTNHHEDDEQAVLFEWASYYPVLQFMHAIPNGAYLAGDKKSRAAQMARLKRQGLKPGVCDVFLPAARHGYHGLYIEMKRRKRDGSSSISPEQRRFIDMVTNEGYLIVVCYGANEAINAIKWYMNLCRIDKPVTLRDVNG